MIRGENNLQNIKFYKKDRPERAKALIVRAQLEILKNNPNFNQLRIEEIFNYLTSFPIITIFVYN